MSIDLLIDTSILLWFLRGDARAARVEVAARDDASTVSVSSISLAEIAIKHAIGKLPDEVGATRRVVGEYGFLELPWTGSHAEALAALPMHHRDPFDRMLISQAQAEGMTIATADPAFAAYDVAVL